MNVFDAKLNKFVDLDQSEKYKNAKKIVADHVKQLDDLKKVFKEKGITAHMTREGGTVRRLKFKVNTYDRLDTKLIPDDIKVEYMRGVDVWVSQVDKYTLGSDVSSEDASP
jgi:hypothetical protein